jgi:hypothetical protein
MSPSGKRRTVSRDREQQTFFLKRASNTICYNLHNTSDNKQITFLVKCSYGGLNGKNIEKRERQNAVY